MLVRFLLSLLAVFLVLKLVLHLVHLAIPCLALYGAWCLVRKYQQRRS